MKKKKVFSLLSEGLLVYSSLSFSDVSPRPQTLFSQNLRSVQKQLSYHDYSMARKEKISFCPPL